MSLLFESINKLPFYRIKNLNVFFNVVVAKLCHEKYIAQLDPWNNVSESWSLLKFRRLKTQSNKVIKMQTFNLFFWCASCARGERLH